jgi:hypothetical protein
MDVKEIVWKDSRLILLVQNFVQRLALVLTLLNLQVLISFSLVNFLIYLLSSVRYRPLTYDAK